jgi:hypothetical protein
VPAGPAAALLHDWLYRLVDEVCFDREYVYFAFVEHFSALLKQIYHLGSTEGRGAYAIPGIKSERRLSLRWSLEHRLNYTGPNLLAFEYAITEGGAELERGQARFDLSTGAAI